MRGKSGTGPASTDGPGIDLSISFFLLDLGPTLENINIPHTLSLFRIQDSYPVFTTGMTEPHPPPELPLPKDLPVRILVQTMTQLVPQDLKMDNDVYSDKISSMLHRISRYHWNCPYWPFENRFYTHGDEFGYNNRLCFFLVDHGTVSNDKEVPFCVMYGQGRICTFLLPTTTTEDDHC